MRLYKLFFLLFFFPILLFAQSPAVEVRAVWLTTNWGLDWPTQNTTVEAQKKELRDMLDRIKRQNFNMVLFQVRAQGAVMYKSGIEPYSSFVRQSNNFDPLTFAIDECHQRGLECHAWLSTYPMESVRSVGKGQTRKTVEKYPDYYKQVDNQWHLDPGRYESRQRILSIVNEIVSNYDVDGIHFDYIRYPSNTGHFPDSDTYKKYGGGKNLHDWRRDNINKLVFDVYDSVKKMKNWVQVSSAPLGRYRVLPSIAPNDGWTAYGTVFQDAGYWMKSGKHDLIFPMIYHKGKYFYPFLDDWVANSNGRLVVPGLGAYQMMETEQNWPLRDITDQMKYIREKGVQGQAFFRTKNVLDNLKGLGDSISTYYPYPAKLPPMPWLDNTSPFSPIGLEVYRDEDGLLNIKWDTPDNDDSYTYTVYMSDTDEVDLNDAYNILETGLHGNHCRFSIQEGDYGMYYTVTASDRCHNESLPACSGFIVLSSEIRK